MSASLAWQYAVVAVLVAFSALSVLRKYLPSLWGRLLARIATVSDLHMGETAFGRLPRLHSVARADVAHPVVCLHRQVVGGGHRLTQRPQNHPEP